MKTTNDIPKAMKHELIDVTKDVLQAQPVRDTALPMNPREAYMTLKQFDTLLGFCNRERERSRLDEYLRYPLMTMDHPLFPLFQVEKQIWYVILSGMRGGHTGHTYAIPVRYLRAHVQRLVTSQHLSQPYVPPAQLVLRHYAQRSQHSHHNNRHLLMQMLKTQFPQYSRQTIWRAIKSLSSSLILQGGRT